MALLDAANIVRKFAAHSARIIAQHLSFFADTSSSPTHSHSLGTADTKMASLVQLTEEEWHKERFKRHIIIAKSTQV